MQGASLKGASLQGASLQRASLQGASLDGARLQGASLEDARLQGASLDGTFLWRAYGAPDADHLENVWVREPQPHSLKTEQLFELKKEAVFGVETKDAIQRIQERFAPLSWPEKYLQDSLPHKYWTDLVATTRESDYQWALASFLLGLACDAENAPYVAQGLIWPTEFDGPGRLDDLGPPHLRPVAKLLLAAAEGKTNDCLGAKGLNTKSIAQLREWAAKEENETEDAPIGETGR